MVNRPDDVRHVVAWLPVTRWVTCILLWVAVTVSWLFPHLDLPLRALAPFGLTAAICRTVVQASVELERSLGEGRTVSVGYQYLRGENLLMSVNQNVPICVAVGTNNGCRPVSTYRNNSEYSFVAARPTTVSMCRSSSARSGGRACD